MKNYYVLVALMNSAFLCAMELHSGLKQDDPVENICYEIDKNILKIDPNAWNKRVIGSYAAYCKRPEFTGNPEKVINLLGEVEKYVPQEHRNDTVFQKLQSHWLVYYLLCELVADRVRQLNAVTGSTIDDLLDANKLIPGLSSQMSRFINQSAHSSYAQSRLLDKPVDEFNFGNEDEEIHYTHLNAWGAGEVYMLVVPKEGACVNGITRNSKHLVWSLENGKENQDHARKIFQFPLNAGEQECFKDQYIVNNNYLIVLGNAGLSGIHFAVSPVLELNKTAAAKNRMWKGSEIFLFKKPTLASRLCQKALWNCSENPYCSRSTDKGELGKLRGSKAAQGLRGFVQDNLFMKIDTRIGLTLEGCK